MEVASSVASFDSSDLLNSSMACGRGMPGGNLTSSEASSFVNCLPSLGMTDRGFLAE